MLDNTLWNTMPLDTDYWVFNTSLQKLAMNQLIFIKNPERTEGRRFIAAKAYHCDNDHVLNLLIDDIEC